MSEQLTNWTARQKVSATHLNEAWNLLRKIAGAIGYDVSSLSQPPDQADPPVTVRFGEIVDAGPGGAADYADERYWVKESVVLPADTGDEPVDWEYIPDVTLDVPQATTNPADPTATDSVTIEPIYTVTNLPELVAGTHALEAGTPVIFFEFRDGQQPTPNLRHLMVMGGAGTGQTYSNQATLIQSESAGISIGASLANLLSFYVAPPNEGGSGLPVELRMAVGADNTVLQSAGGVAVFDYVRFMP